MISIETSQPHVQIMEIWFNGISPLQVMTFFRFPSDDLVTRLVAFHKSIGTPLPFKRLTKAVKEEMRDKGSQDFHGLLTKYADEVYAGTNTATWDDKAGMNSAQIASVVGFSPRFRYLISEMLGIPDSAAGRRLLQHVFQELKTCAMYYAEHGLKEPPHYFYVKLRLNKQGELWLVLNLSALAKHNGLARQARTA